MKNDVKKFFEGFAAGVLLFAAVYITSHWIIPLIGG